MKGINMNKHETYAERCIANAKLTHKMSTEMRDILTVLDGMAMYFEPNEYIFAIDYLQAALSEWVSKLNVETIGNSEHFLKALKERKEMTQSRKLMGIDKFSDMDDQHRKLLRKSVKAVIKGLAK